MPGLREPLAAQAGPQSCRNRPIPRTPFAPRSATVFSGGRPDAVQAEGASNAASPTAWIGTEDACSPPILTSALSTGPHW